MALARPHPDVVHTELQDGAVLLNMTTGFYYSLDIVGLEIWRQLESAETVDEVARVLTQRFDVDETRARASIDRMLEQLKAEELVTVREPLVGTAAVVLTTSEAKAPFLEPSLIKHDEPLSKVSLHPFDPQLPLAE